jgi:hypothetical protein
MAWTFKQKSGQRVQGEVMEGEAARDRQSTQHVRPGDAFFTGESKWNKIEHRLFSYLSINWRGKPLDEMLTVINLIASTTTAAGLKE